MSIKTSSHHQIMEIAIVGAVIKYHKPFVWYGVSLYSNDNIFLFETYTFYTLMFTLFLYNLILSLYKIILLVYLKTYCNEARVVRLFEDNIDFLERFGIRRFVCCSNNVFFRWYFELFRYKFELIAFDKVKLYSYRI